MTFCEAQTLAVQALVQHLGYQTGLAEQEVFQMPLELAEEIVAATKQPTQVAGAIRDSLSRLYDRRREGHAQSAKDELERQRLVLAARCVLENQLDMSVVDSVERTRRMTGEELDQIASTPVTEEGKKALVLLLVDIAARLETIDVAQAATEKAAMALEAKDAAELKAKVAAEAAEKAAEEAKVAGLEAERAASEVEKIASAVTQEASEDTFVVEVVTGDASALGPVVTAAVDVQADKVTAQIVVPAASEEAPIVAKADAPA